MSDHPGCPGCERLRGDYAELLRKYRARADIIERLREALRRIARAALAATPDAPCDDHRPDGPSPHADCKCAEVDRLGQAALAATPERTCDEGRRGVLPSDLEGWHRDAPGSGHTALARAGRL